MVTRTTRRRQKRERRAHGRLLAYRGGMVAVLVVMLFVFRDSIRVDSASLSVGTSEQLSITGGVLTIAPGQPTDSIMEIGNNGNEIISTGPINIRPNGSPQGTQFVGNANGTQSLLLTGQLTLNTGGIVLNGVRKTTWPSVDSWKTVNHPDGTYWYTFNDAQTSLATGTPPNVAGVPGLALYSDNGDPALLVENANNGYIGYASGAANFNDSDVTLYGDLKFFSLYVCSSSLATPQQRATECHSNQSLYKAAWTTYNMNAGSGVDADMIDGIDTYFVGTCNGVQGSVCLCAVMQNATTQCYPMTQPVYDVL